MSEKNKLSKETLSNIISTLADSFEKEHVEKSLKFANSIPEESLNEMLYYYNIRKDNYLFNNALKQMNDGIIYKTLETINPKIAFFVSNYGFIQNHYRNILETHEGSACIYDKTSTIMESIYEHLTEGSVIEFNYEGEYTFHLPKKIFRNNNEILEFYIAIEAMYYGRVEKYLEFRKKHQV